MGQVRHQMSLFLLADVTFTDPMGVRRHGKVMVPFVGRQLPFTGGQPVPILFRAKPLLVGVRSSRAIGRWTITFCGTYGRLMHMGGRGKGDVPAGGPSGAFGGYAGRAANIIIRKSDYSSRAIHSGTRLIRLNPRRNSVEKTRRRSPLGEVTVSIMSFTGSMQHQCFRRGLAPWLAVLLIATAALSNSACQAVLTDCAKADRQAGECFAFTLLAFRQCSLDVASGANPSASNTSCATTMILGFSVCLNAIPDECNASSGSSNSRDD